MDATISSQLPIKRTFRQRRERRFKKLAYTFRHSHHNYEFSNNILLKNGI